MADNHSNSEDPKTIVCSSPASDSTKTFAEHETCFQSLSSIQTVRCTEAGCNCGLFHCPLCDKETFPPVPKLSQVREHVAVHWKSRVEYRGKFVVQCLKTCDKGAPHYHCPKCGQTVYRRSSFSAHLECHRPTEVFLTMAAVINPNLFQYIPGDAATVLASVQDSCNVSCNLTGTNWCVVQGKWEHVNRARLMLEDLVVLPVTMEIEDSPVVDIDESSREQVTNELEKAGENGGGVELQPPSLVTPRKRGRPPKVHKDDRKVEEKETAVPDEGEQNSRESGGGCEEITDGTRRSRRRRVVNRRLSEYAVPKKLRQSGLGSEDYDDLESLSEDEFGAEEGQDENVKIVPVHYYEGDNSVDNPELLEVPSGVDLNIQQDDLGATTVSLTLKDDTPPALPVRKVVVSRAKPQKRCASCRKTFATSKQLTNHFKLGQCFKVGAGDLKCTKCEYKAHRSFDLKLHFERHHQEKMWECSVCNKKFGPLYDLKMHYKYTGHNGGQKTQRTKSECPICRKVIQQKGMQNHIRTVHENIRPYSCEICSKAFWTKHLLKTHLESHKDMADRVRPFTCDICNQGFFHKMALDDHRTKHTSSPKYSCEQCGKQFYYYTGWQRHLVSHTEDRPYECSICKKAFKTSSNLYAHKQSHGQPAFVCRCGKAYQHKHNLVAHARRCPLAGSHEAEGETVEVDTFATNQRFMCGYCTETFNDFAAVQEHLGQHVVAGDTDSVQIEAGELDASMLEHLAVAAVEAGSDNLDTLQQLALTAMHHSAHTSEGETVVVDESESGTAATSIISSQQVLDGDESQEMVSILVTRQDGEVQQILEVKETESGSTHA